MQSEPESQHLSKQELYEFLERMTFDLETLPPFVGNLAEVEDELLFGWYNAANQRNLADDAIVGANKDGEGGCTFEDLKNYLRRSWDID